MKRGFKNYSIIICGMVILLSSCSTSKEVRQMNRKVRGNWVLQTIVTEGATGKPKDKIFNEADFSCFIGSEWKFNKHDGIYTIVDQQKICPGGKTWISWSFHENANAAASFVFMKAADKKTGIGSGPTFNMAVLELNNSSMKLKQGIVMDGQPAALIYNFVKQ